ncbi:hypothetical protein BH23CHL3_BH23CHL3_07400 [soil metagenome]
MSNSFLRIFGTMMVAFGLIAGSFGVTMAQGIDTSGGDAGNGGNAEVGGGNNNGTIDQDNEQEQNQDAEQGQDVDQDNDQVLDQGNSLSGIAGGSVDTDCRANQNDDGEAGDGAEADGGESDAGDGGDTVAGDDSADCAVGDSTVGDSATGDSNLANAGDGGDGGDADNEGSVNVTTEIVVTLIRILESILSGGDTIIGDGDDNGVVDDDDDDMGNGGGMVPDPTDNLPFTCTFPVKGGDNVSSGRCIVDGESVVAQANFCEQQGSNQGRDIMVGNVLTCEVDGTDFNCEVTSLTSTNNPNRDRATVNCTSAREA